MSFFLLQVNQHSSRATICWIRCQYHLKKVIDFAPSMLLVLQILEVDSETKALRKMKHVYVSVRAINFAKFDFWISFPPSENWIFMFFPDNFLLQMPFKIWICSLSKSHLFLNKYCFDIFAFVKIWFPSYNVSIFLWSLSCINHWLNSRVKWIYFQNSSTCW